MTIQRKNEFDQKREMQPDLGLTGPTNGHSRLWQIAVLGAFALHLAGALLALPSAAHMIDFAAYYVAAWAVRTGGTFYEWEGTVQAAAAVGLQQAAWIKDLPVDYPPLLAFLLVPFSYLPYDVARGLWSVALVLALWASSRLLVRLFGYPLWLMLLAVFSFSPITLGLAAGNMSPLLLWGVLALAEATMARRASWLRILPYIFVTIIKIFPVAWLWAPLTARRWRLIFQIALIATITSVIMIAIRPNLTMDFVTNLTESNSPIRGRQGSAGGEPQTIENHQANLLGFVTHLTQPTKLQYSRWGVANSNLVVAPLLPLSQPQAYRLTLLLMAVIFIAVLLTTWHMVRIGYVQQSHWALVAGLLVVQPFTLFQYLVVLMPGLLLLAQAPRPSMRWLFAITYLVIGLARFVGFLTALMPPQLFLLTAHLGTLASVLIWLGVYWYTLNRHSNVQAPLEQSD